MNEGKTRTLHKNREECGTQEFKTEETSARTVILGIAE
jgi:hypothetical protein